MTASRIPDIEAFEERAAIAEYDGRLTRLQAESFAATEQGFASAGAYCGHPHDPPRSKLRRNRKCPPRQPRLRCQRSERMRLRWGTISRSRGPQRW